MRVTSDFHYPHFVDNIEQALAASNLIIPHSLLIKMSLFYRRFALTHEEPPETIAKQIGYFRQQMFSHRAKRYALHYALVLAEPEPYIQIKLFTEGQNIADIRFDYARCLTLTCRPTLPLTCVDSSIESIIRDISQLYFRVPDNYEVIEKAVRLCCKMQCSHFRNHIHGRVKLTYYGDQFILHDTTLQLTRHFRLPRPFSRLITPTLKDYLTLPALSGFNFEPTFNNADVHKVVGDKNELLQFIYDDFRFKNKLEACLIELVTTHRTVFRHTTTLTVGSYDRPVITVTRKKPTSYKKIHYIINNTIIKSLVRD